MGKFFSVMAIIAGCLSVANGQSFLNGRVAYYPLNGNANDGVGVNHGTVVGATLAKDRFGKSNMAYSFNGTNNYIFFNWPPLNQMTSWTISAWMNPSKSPQQGIVVCLGYDDGDPYTATGVACGMTGPAGSPPGTDFTGTIAGITWVPSGFSFPATNTWYHLMMTRSSGVIKFYVNGVQTSRTSYNTPRTPTSFRIGAAHDPNGGRFFAGLIDEVSIYNRGLSSSEAQQLYLYQAELVPDITSVGKALRLDFTNLVTGGSYQIEASSDLTRWTNYGAPFIAPATNCSQYVDVGEWNGFFRIRR